MSFHDATPYTPIPLASGEGEDPSPPIGEDPALDAQRGEYLITKPTGWSDERWDAYVRGLSS